MKSKTYNGLDLLKFIMALFVVMIHVKPNVHSETLTTVFNPILSIAVPIFFVLSSVLIFNKLTIFFGGGTLRLLDTVNVYLYCIFVGWLLIFGLFYLKDHIYQTDSLKDALNLLRICFLVLHFLAHGFLLHCLFL